RTLRKTSAAIAGSVRIPRGEGKDGSAVLAIFASRRRRTVQAVDSSVRVESGGKTRRVVSGEAAWSDGPSEGAEHGRGWTVRIYREALGREMVARGSGRVSRAREANAYGMGRGIFAGARQHESGDDGEVHARGKAGAPEPGLAGALFGGERDASGAVGELLRDFGSDRGGLCAEGFRLML